LRYWLCITTPKNWEIVKKNNVWGVEERYETTMKRLELNDIFLFYITNPAKAIAGIYKVASKWYYDEKSLDWNKLYPHRIKIIPFVVPLVSIPVDEKLLEELLFITDKSRRGRTVFFFPSMVLLTEEDYKTVEKWLQQNINMLKQL